MLASATLPHRCAPYCRDLRPRQNEDTLWQKHCILRYCPSVAKRGNIVARGADTRNVSKDFQEQFLCLGHKICVCHKCCARGKTSQHLRNMTTSVTLPPQCVLALSGPKTQQELQNDRIPELLITLGSENLKFHTACWHSCRDKHVTVPVILPSRPLRSVLPDSGIKGDGLFAGRTLAPFTLPAPVRAPFAVISLDQQRQAELGLTPAGEQGHPGQQELGRVFLLPRNGSTRAIQLTSTGTH